MFRHFLESKYFQKERALWIWATKSHPFGESVSAKHTIAEWNRWWRDRKWKRVTVMECFEIENLDVLSSGDDPWVREERESMIRDDPSWWLNSSQCPLRHRHLLCFSSVNDSSCVIVCLWVIILPPEQCPSPHSTLHLCTEHQCCLHMKGPRSVLCSMIVQTGQFNFNI